MASNRLPGRLDALFALAENMADGLREHEAEVGVKRNTEASPRTSVAMPSSSVRTLVTSPLGCTSPEAGMTARTVFPMTICSFTRTVARSRSSPPTKNEVAPGQRRTSTRS